MEKFAYNKELSVEEKGFENALNLFMKKL